MTRIRILALALFAVLLLAVPARADAAAAKPIALGAGTSPWLVVDPAGTAHMVFRSTPDDGIVYCRLPRGKRACDVRTALPIGAPAVTYKLLRRAADGVLIALQTDKDEDFAPLSQQGGRLWASYSSDNGATFSPPAVLASGIDESFVASLTPDGLSVLLVQLQGNAALLRRAPFAGPDLRVLDIDDTPGTPATGKVTTLPDGRMLLIHSTLDDTTGWRVFNGGDPLDVNAWPSRGVLTNVRGYQLATGPRGVFMLDRHASFGQKLNDLPPATIRSFDTKTLRWRKARGALADQQIFTESGFSQDGAGRLHVVASNADYGGLGCVMYARTSTKRTSWFGRTTILYFTRAKSRMPSGASAEAAPDGRGFASWTDASGQAWAIALKQAKGTYRPIAKGPSRPTCGR